MKICNYTITCCKDRYPQIKVNGKHYFLHRYIYYCLYNNPIRVGYFIDHINRNILDIIIENLRELLPTENNRNKNKKNGTSIYKGVYYNQHAWECQLRKDNINHRFRYKNELHAAYHFNLLVLEHKLDHVIELNPIEQPIDFIIKVNSKRVRKDDLPTGVYKRGNKYVYKLHDRYSKNFNTQEEALYERNQIINNEIKLMDDSMILNEKGIPIFRINAVEIMVDAHRYEEVKMYKLSILSEYVTIYINGVYLRLSRYLLNCTDKTKHVDHIDGNVYNNQMNNLRIVTALQNAQNKSSRKGSISKYTGVSYDSKSKKWIGRINNKHYKCFNIEYEAAMYRDMLAYEYNLLGNYYKINLPVELQMNLYIKSLSEEFFNFNYLFY